MPQVPKAPSKGKKKKIITIVVVALLIVAAVAAGVLLRWQQNKSASDGSQSPQDNTVQRLPDVVSEVQDLNAEGKTEEAAKVAEERLKDTSTPDDIKYMLYIQQGNGKFNDGDTKGAIAEYEKARAVKETHEIDSLLGAAYAKAGDKAKAIDYYKKAIPLVPADSPIVDDEKEYLRQAIIALGGQP